MAITTINSLAIPAGTVVSADLTYPLTGFSSTGIDDNATSTAITIDSSQNVGIGTSSPSQEFHLRQTSGDCNLLIDSANGASQIFFGDDESVNIGNIRYDHASNYMRFSTNSAEAMRIDSSGNVGIGTTSPEFGIHYVSGTSGNTTVLGSGDELALESSGDVGMTFRGGTGNFASMYFAFPSDTYRGFIQYGEADDYLGFGTAKTERMRINSSGNLLVGCTSAMGGGGSDGINGFGVQGSGGGRFVALQNTTDANMYIAKNSGYTSSNFIFFYAAGTKVGSIYTNGTTTTYATSSDERLKENIVDAPAGNIDAIRVRSFDWKADGSHQTYGMVAQELVDVAPEAVAQGETDDDMWGVDYSKLVPMMIKEIQDLKAEVAALKGA